MTMKTIEAEQDRFMRVAYPRTLGAHLDAQGKASPTDRSDSENSWIDWELESGDDPAQMAAALEQAGMTVDQFLAA